MVWSHDAAGEYSRLARTSTQRLIDDMDDIADEVAAELGVACGNAAAKVLGVFSHARQQVAHAARTSAAIARAVQSGTAVVEQAAEMAAGHVAVARGAADYAMALPPFVCVGDGFDFEPYVAYVASPVVHSVSAASRDADRHASSAALAPKTEEDEASKRVLPPPSPPMRRKMDQRKTFP